MDPVISCHHLDFSYKGKETDISDISLTVSKGSILGILGHNGSGKSTLFRLLAGLLQPQKGEVLFHGSPMSEMPRGLLYKKLGLMIETPVFYNHLSLQDNFRLLQCYRGIPGESIEKVLKLTQADLFRGKKAGTLSTGMRQRAGLAAALLHDPEVLILDEPTSGLDPDGMIQVRELMLGLKKEQKTILLSSHLLPEVQRICDHVVILRQGRIIFDGSMEMVNAYRDMEELYVSLQPNRND